MWAQKIFGDPTTASIFSPSDSTFIFLYRKTQRYQKTRLNKINFYNQKNRLSHLGDFNFDNYTPSPEFDVSALRPSEISAKGLKIFYIGILIYSLIAIVTCIGQIVSYNSCSTWNSGAQAGAEFFYVFSFFTLIGSTVVLGMSVYALIYKMDPNRI